MDKEDVVYLYNGLLLSHKKEQNYAICRDVNGPRDCHTEWSKSERGKQISYINAYIRNLEDGTDEPICRAGQRGQVGYSPSDCKELHMIEQLHFLNGDTDVENRLVDTVEEEVGTNWE